MISICIPIHNYYAYPLVRRLRNQIDKLNVSDEVEIVCIDDHSSGYHLKQNMGIVDVANYLRLEQNVGRSRIRNLFLKYTKGDWLLFLDDDSLVPDNFIKKYREKLDDKYGVIVGGRVYDKGCDDRIHRLRYLYGTKVESLPADRRSQHPYRSFMSNNFLVRRDVFEKIKFDQRITKYGHEDTLFGYRLEQNNIPILHVNNPVTNGDVETNPEFLHKTIEAVENLAYIYEFMWEDQKFCSSVRLLNTYAKVRRMNLQNLVYFFFKMLKGPLESHFVSGSGVSIAQFNFYKLGIFIRKIHHPETKRTADY